MLCLNLGGGRNIPFALRNAQIEVFDIKAGKYSSHKTKNIASYLRSKVLNLRS